MSTPFTKTLKSLFTLYLLSAIFQIAALLPLASAEEPAFEAYGRACLTVEETSPEGQIAAVHTTVFDQNSKPGPGKRLVLYADANTDGYVLVAAFHDQDPRLAQADGQGLPDQAAGGGPYKLAQADGQGLPDRAAPGRSPATGRPSGLPPPDQPAGGGPYKLAQADGQGLPDRAADGGPYKLANGWRPQWAHVKAWEETSLPVPPAAWTWNEGSEPFEIYVIFFKKAFPGIADLESLVAAMQDPGTDAKLLDLQARKLRGEINLWLGGQNPDAFQAGAMPSAWGGTLRGIRFPWRQQAQKAIFSDSGQGLLIYRYGI